MDANELRRAFTGYFEERGHTVVPSAGLIPHHPSAPMFTNSGMMQFVPYFLGEEQPPFVRATSVQKCVRAGGKHNDLDAIGRSLRHLSFFEMLGNFSFGDYFKTDAIRWAWEFITGTLELDPARLWVTVHVSDDEAEGIWRNDIGFPIERIQRLDKANFWEMGDTGPCGPSSEVFFDFGRADLGGDDGPANPANEERYVEIWNLVFPQYFRQPSGDLVDLPKRGIDTGAGLERMLAAMLDNHDIYATDELTALVDEAESITGRRLGADRQTDIALRLMADHARTMTFLVNDGVVPSNEERGYVLRRIIRRAVRFAYLLGATAVVDRMAGACIETMGEAYPELRANREHIVSTLVREEDGFRRTLERGSVLLDSHLARLGAGESLPGEVAFDLYETYGFPLEVTQEITADLGVDVDLDGYQRALDRARQISQQGQKRVDAFSEAGTYQDVLDRFGATDFVGREQTDVATEVLAIVGDSVFIARSPFYAESGGQVGDTGWITTETGKAEVLDTTYALPGLHRHQVAIVEGDLQAGQDAVAAIDVDRRNAIRRNHTATHILHWALRQILGEHVKQQGSWVGPDRLRFDFSHYAAVSAEEIVAIEDLANREILANDPVRHYETTKHHAAELGAIAFFGEKYGDIVRVLEAGRHSVELCGGTHVRALGDIGLAKIVSEGSIGSNLRRIEAVTGLGPIERLRHEEAVLTRAGELLSVLPDEIVAGVERRLEEIKALRDELKALRRQAAAGRSVGLAAAAVDGVVVTRVDGVARDDLRDLALAVRDQQGVRAVVLGGAPEGGGAALVAAVTKDSGLHASDLIAEASRTINGGGGKAPDVAVAGGRDPSRLDQALDQARAAAGIAT